jgi:hypothetical protein
MKSNGSPMRRLSRSVGVGSTVVWFSARSAALEDGAVDDWGLGRQMLA